MWKGRLLNFLKSVVFLGLGIAILIWVVRKSNLDWESIKAGFARANYFWVGVSLLIGALGMVFRAIRWQMLLATFGKKPTFTNTIFAVLNGYFFNLFLPRLGEVTRCGLLSRYERIPLVKVAGTALWDRVIDLFFLALVMGLMLLTQFRLVWDYTYANILGSKIDAARELLASPLGIVIVLASLVVLYFIFVRWMQPAIACSSVYLRLKNVFSGFSEGIRSISNLNSFPMFTFHSVMIWVCYFAMMYSSMFAFPEVGAAGVGAAITLLVFGTFGMMAPVQGGMGAFHLAVQASLILYGVRPEEALLFAFVIHATQQGMILVLGFLSFILLPIYNKDRLILGDEATVASN
jgi:glycosyltransferase 2 family protein